MIIVATGRTGSGVNSHIMAKLYSYSVNNLVLIIDPNNEHIAVPEIDMHFIKSNFKLRDGNIFRIIPHDLSDCLKEVRPYLRNMIVFIDCADLIPKEKSEIFCSFSVTRSHSLTVIFAHHHINNVDARIMINADYLIVHKQEIMKWWKAGFLPHIAHSVLRYVNYHERDHFSATIKVKENKIVDDFQIERIPSF